MTYLATVSKYVTAVLGNDFGEIGRPVTIRRYTVTSGGPGGSPTRTPSDTEANAYFDQINDLNAPSGSLIQIGDRLAYVDQEVRIDDEIVRDGTTWQVANVKPIELGSGTALWIAQVRS